MNQLSGYIELELDGQALAFKFGSNAWALFCEMHKLELYQITESGVFGKWEGEKMILPPDVTKLRDLFHCAHVAACRSAGVEPKVNLYKLGDLLDESDSAMLKLQDTIVHSKMFGVSLAGEDKDANFQSPGQE